VPRKEFVAHFVSRCMESGEPAAPLPKPPDEGDGDGDGEDAKAAKAASMLDVLVSGGGDYKVGDHVCLNEQYLRNMGPPAGPMSEGDVGTVVDLNPGRVFVEFQGQLWHFLKAQLSLVKREGSMKPASKTGKSEMLRLLHTVLAFEERVEIAMNNSVEFSDLQSLLVPFSVKLRRASDRKTGRRGKGKKSKKGRNNNKQVRVCVVDWGERKRELTPHQLYSGSALASSTFAAVAGLLRPALPGSRGATHAHGRAEAPRAADGAREAPPVQQLLPEARAGPGHRRGAAVLRGPEPEPGEGGRGRQDRVRPGRGRRHRVGQPAGRARGGVRRGERDSRGPVRASEASAKACKRSERKGERGSPETYAGGRKRSERKERGRPKLPTTAKRFTGDTVWRRPPEPPPHGRGGCARTPPTNSSFLLASLACSLRSPARFARLLASLACSLRSLAGTRLTCERGCSRRTRA
jgi:hypothetical protein